MPTGKRNYLPVITVHPLTAHLGRRSTKCIGHLLATLLRHLTAGHLLAALLQHLIAGHLLATLLRHLITGHLLAALLRHLVAGHLLTTLSARHLLTTPLILLSL